MRVPVVLQADRAECGLACIAMVAGFHGHRASLREHRAEFRVSQRGATLASMRRYAERLGLKCRAVRLELDELPQLRLPAILHWELDHFVVLKSVSRHRAVIVDPAVGVRRASLAEVDGKFTGVALEVAPTPAFTPKQEAKTIGLRPFLRSFRGLGRPLGGIFAMTVALQAFALVMPLNMQFTVDQGVRQGDLHVAAALATGFGLIAIIGAAIEYLRGLLVQHVGNSSAFRMVTGLAHHMLRLPDAWFAARHTGDVMSRFESAEPIRRFLSTGAFALVVDGVMALGSLAALLLYAWDMAFAVCGFMAILALLRLGSYAPLRDLTHESIAAGAREHSSFIENIERHRAIQLLGAESQREDAWGTRYVESINAGARLVRFGLHIGFAAAVVSGVQGVTMLLFGAAKVIAGEFTLGMLFAFTSYSGMFGGRVNALIRGALELRMLRLHRERIADIALEERDAPGERPGRRCQLRGALVAHGLCFSYGEAEDAVVDGLDFDIAAGEFVAVAGQSGAGKSTLVKLLCGLLRPTSGRLLVDGVDLAQLDVVDYRSQLGVVMQDDDLFSGSLMENIALDEAGADPARVEAAARIACLHQEVERMPMGYLTLVGHMGSTLSGGQRQRVMIARAVHRAPKVLILDEGTAHLNDALQQRVLDNLARLNTTIIAVTHDQRVIERAQRVIWM